MSENESLLTFPCEFPIKVMGLAADDFDALVFGLVSRHVTSLAEHALTTRPSSGGKYVAVTVMLQVESREQLDAVYRELSGCDRIVMVL